MNQHSSQNKKKYGLLFFETFQEAKSAQIEIQNACNDVDQLNVVIKAEGSMDDQELLGIHTKVKVFAGAAWHLIHTRRKDDQWYDQSH